jgi:hypothetical protein
MQTEKTKTQGVLPLDKVILPVITEQSPDEVWQKETILQFCSGPPGIKAK